MLGARTSRYALRLGANSWAMVAGLMRFASIAVGRRNWTFAGSGEGGRLDASKKATHWAWERSVITLRAT
jgi:hypothetical protein